MSVYFINFIYTYLLFRNPLKLFALCGFTNALKVSVEDSLFIRIFKENEEKY